MSAPASLTTPRAPEAPPSGGTAFELVLAFDAPFVEETVLRAVAARGCEPAFRAERDPLYEMRDLEAREARFHALHAMWFERLGLDRPVREAFLEQPEIAKRAGTCRIVPARSGKTEGADLLVPRGAPAAALRATVLLQLRPSALLDAGRLRVLLRRELMHVADILDPRFEYDPALPVQGSGPAFDALLLRRYRVIWNASVDGRLVRRGWLDARARLERRAEFAAAFPLPDGDLESAFSVWFDANEVRHPDLLEFASRPQGAGGMHRCPLCGFPARIATLEEHGAGSDGVRSEIERRHPGWSAEAGCCRQCAGLYSAAEGARHRHSAFGS